MPRFAQLLATLFALAVAMPAQAAIIYEINRNVGVGSVVGSVTTDGTLGSLQESNILEFSLQLTDTTNSVLLAGLAPGDVRVHFSPNGGAGSPLMATATELTFNFDGNGYAHFDDTQAFDDGGDFYCLTAGDGHCGGISGNRGESIAASGPSTGTLKATAARSGTITFATVRVPEPASVAIIGIGLAGLGLLRRRRPAQRR